MALLVKPDIKVDKIEIKKDENNPDSSKKLINTYGSVFPLVKINEYVLNMGELISFELNVAPNCLPSFIMTIDDSTYDIRESLKEAIDKCVVFIGYKNWYIKFNGIINQTISDAGDPEITLIGTLFNELLYNDTQQAFKEQTVENILKSIAEKTKMGLFTVTNNSIGQTLTYCVNSNNRYIDFFDIMVKRYTDNIWCIDPHYHFHVASIDALFKKRFDKYTLNGLGETIPETDITITSNPHYPAKDEEAEALKIRLDYYSIDTNFSKMYVDSASEYYLNKSLIPSDKTIGIGSKAVNTFTGFSKQKFPFYAQRVNKQLGGTMIKVELKNLIFEIAPFSVINLEIYLPKRGEKPIRLDEEHSGKKIVIGYSYKFTKPDEETPYPSITQTLNLI